VRETVTRLTFDPARDGAPVWSPDGTRVAFASERGGVPQVYVKDASGTVAEERLTDGDRPKIPLDWSRDGRYLLYRELDPATATNDLKALPMDGDRQPITLLETPFNESVGRFSPDGAWLAYRSDESGQPELFVRSFGGQTPPAEGGRWQISNSGASDIKWRDDGRELYYETLDGRIMAVAIEAGPSGLRAGTPRELFTADIDTANLHSFDATGDGERFLLLLRPRNQDQRRMTAVVEWQATLRPR
jgi:Tol biopolymer transport system component